MPNRILKDSICTSESIDQLTPFEETFFYRLIVNCDDYGLFDARLSILKARCFPLKERITLRQIESALTHMASIGIVQVYVVDERPYLCLPSWSVHQQVRAQKRKFPPPDITCDQLISDDIRCPRNPIQYVETVDVETLDEKKDENTAAEEDDSAPERVREAADAEKPDKLAISPRCDQQLGTVVREYQQRLGSLLSSQILATIEASLDAGMSPDVLILAADRAVDAGVPTGRYVGAILRDWRAQRVKTLADIARIGDQRKAQNKAPPKQKRTFADIAREEMMAREQDGDGDAAGDNSGGLPAVLYQTD
jgi:DnaD/phage-associated family protein